MGSVFVGIDPGMSCGWAVLDAEGERVASGAWPLKGGRYDGAGMYLVRLERHLGELLGLVEPTALAFEEVRRHAGTEAGHVYGAITGTIMRCCEHLGVSHCGAPVGTVKKHATGKGNASKDEMKATAQERFGAGGSDDNEADALWIASALHAGLL